MKGDYEAYGMATGAVITAAGMSSRMGDFKPMLPLGDTSVIGHMIRRFRKGGVGTIVVVTGNRSAELETHLRKVEEAIWESEAHAGEARNGPLRIICVRNERYAETQMFDSVKLGLAAIHRKCDCFFFTPVDAPLFGEATLEALLESNADLACPEWDGRAGHPVLIADSLTDEILAYDGTGGLRGALASCGARMQRIPVDDCGVIYDMDTKEQYEKILSLYEQSRGS